MLVGIFYFKKEEVQKGERGKGENGREGGGVREEGSGGREGWRKREKGERGKKNRKR